MRELEIPPRYQQVSLSDFKAAHQALPGRSLYIVGNPGVGKTHLMVALAIRQTILDSKKEFPVDRSYARFTNVPNLLSRIKKTFTKGPGMEETEEDVYNEYAEACWLYLDDFGTEQASDWTFQTLYRIIDHRWNFKYPTIVSGNIQLESIAGGYSERIASRIMGMCDVIELQGSDRREKR
jgi:DNA replication protein DnaC